MSGIRFRIEDEIDEMEQHRCFLENLKIDRYWVEQMREVIISTMLMFLAWEDRRVREEEFRHLVNWMKQREWMYGLHEFLKRKHWESQIRLLNSQINKMREIRDHAPRVVSGTPAELLIGRTFQIRSLAKALFEALVALGYKPLLYQKGSEFRVVINQINSDGWKLIK